MSWQLVFNFIAFQIGWAACVLGGAHQLPWLGSGIALIVIAAHLAWVPRPRNELSLILLTAVIGLSWDSLLVTLGLTGYYSGTLFDGAAPHWIMALWMLFATTLNVSLRWLKGRWLLAAAFGAVGGPLSFWAGQRLGGVEFPNAMLSLAVLGLGWAVLMPLLLKLAERFDGVGSAAQPVSLAYAGER